jgi:hypothetical protein
MGDIDALAEIISAHFRNSSTRIIMAERAKARMAVWSPAAYIDSLARAVAAAMGSGLAPGSHTGYFE